MFLFDLTGLDTKARFPSTRYQGSKYKYVDWIWHCLKDIPFETALDAFGGTGCISHLLKSKGKTVAYNDILKFNSIIGKALIENSREKIDPDDLAFILSTHSDTVYPHFIEETFEDIYFTTEENQWLDTVTTNIRKIDNVYKQAIAYFALFQSCIIKRPYNLFHRKNLNIRTQDVKRSFGNKTSWDAPFESHYLRFIEEANNAVFSNGKSNVALNSDAARLPNTYDLVYIDTPYISAKNTGINYLDFYHFLEGIVHYDEWDKFIDKKTKHKRFKLTKSPWADAQAIEGSFDHLIDHFSDSVIAISYRSDGVPSIDKIADSLRKHDKSVTIYESPEMQYALSKKRSSEILIIGQ